MQKPKSLKPYAGAPVPLFDRLTDGNPFCDEEAVCFRVLDREGLVASVQDEVRRLLATRSNIPMSRWEAHHHTVLDYGIPDFTHFSPRHGEHRSQVARVVARAIGIYEPRLRAVELLPIVAESTREEAFRFLLRAKLVCGQVVEAISFPLAL